ncbi:MAG: 3-oxoacyl-[acyl-carrier-protein] reductase [Candidatus Omnitrophica bacterium]|nr:3-oxoacyl-[acyl-carrier-protein] reductase [Candidatus Omnitrophota bacterium]
MLLKDKISIVTGGARGIGKAIALKLAQEGSNIAFCDVNAETLASAEKEIRATGRDVLSAKVDVTLFEEAKSFVQKTLDKFGKINILINNAGITRDGLLVRMGEADWDAVLNVNLKGTFNFTKATAKVMMKERGGKIVNIASIIGLIGNAGQANYAASKGGVIAFTKSIAKELAARNINVNAIAPGFIETQMTQKLTEDVKSAIMKQVPLGRWGTGEDVANIALFLVGDASSYITGQVIQVDGGMVT